MQSATITKYGTTSQAFHWVTVALVIVLLVTGLAGDVEADEPGNATFLWHSSLGVIVLGLVILRVISRLFVTAPPLPSTMSGTERALARLVHLALYVLLFALPLTGWLVASNEGATVSVFGIASLPRLSWGAGAGELWEEVHEVLGYAILVIAGLHALAALKHHFVDRDGVLRSMLPGGR